MSIITLTSDYGTKENLEKFAKTCDVITFEFENNRKPYIFIKF